MCPDEGRDDDSMPVCVCVCAGSQTSLVHVQKRHQLTMFGVAVSSTGSSLISVMYLSGFTGECSNKEQTVSVREKKTEAPGEFYHEKGRRRSGFLLTGERYRYI